MDGKYVPSPSERNTIGNDGSRQDPPENERLEGIVVRMLGDFGFVSCPDIPGDDLYFKREWFQGSAEVREGDAVSFLLKTFGDRLQAHYLSHAGPASRDDPTVTPVARKASASPTGNHVFDWAYLGHMPNVLSELAGLALPERWEFKNTPRDPDRPLPILYSYFVHTFGRLARERKVPISDDSSWAAFNTGLVDSRYEPIHALFSRNIDPRAAWKLSGFCVPGEEPNGQQLVRQFSALPEGAHYFDEPADMLYDTRAGEPECDWRHIVIENIDRFPGEFIDDHWPAGFVRTDHQNLIGQDRMVYFRQLGQAIESDSRIYRMILNRFKDAVSLAVKRASWNFRTAVPTYYPKVNQLQLLLPICLVSDEKVDLALAVEPTKSGRYIGHTVLLLDWAYLNARLVSRPDSDWLQPDSISESQSGSDFTQI